MLRSLFDGTVSKLRIFVILFVFIIILGIVSNVTTEISEDEPKMYIFKHPFTTDMIHQISTGECHICNSNVHVHLEKVTDKMEFHNTNEYLLYVEGRDDSGVIMEVVLYVTERDYAFSNIGEMPNLTVEEVISVE